MGARFENEPSRRRSNAMVRNDVDAHGPASHDSSRSHGCHWRTGVDEDDNRKILDNQLRNHSDDMLRRRGKSEGD